MFEHVVVEHYYTTAERLERELEIYAFEGWEVAGMAKHMGNMVIILKRKAQRRDRPQFPWERPAPVKKDKPG